MELALADKVVFITGASGGIGRALAEEFAAEGCRLALHGHARSDELAAWLARQPFADRALAVSADVADPAQMEAAMSAAAARFGRVDICVANAGVWVPPPLPLHEVPVARIRQTLDVNLLGALWTARAFLASLARTGPRADGHGASISFVGSTAGRFGESGHAEYAAAKAGLHGLMLSLKNEIVHLDPFGRVNMVQPGWTVTHMVRPALAVPGAISAVLSTMPLRQLGRARDVARAIVMLSSPAASRHVSGEALTVAGGMEGRLQWAADDVDEEAVRRRAQER